MALIPCSECDKEISNKASACPHCGAPVGGQKGSLPSDVKMSEKGSDVVAKKDGVLNKKIGCLPMLGIGFVILIVVGQLNKEDEKVASTPTHSAQSSSVSVGDNARVVVDSGDVFVAVNEAAFKRWMSLAVAKDYLGMADLEAQGVVFGVPSGTKVKVIGTAFTRREVRIMEGEHFGRSGWVPTEFVQT